MILLEWIKLNPFFQALKGSYFYAMGDHGGLMVAVPQFQSTKDLL